MWSDLPKLVLNEISKYVSINTLLNLSRINKLYRQRIIHLHKYWEKLISNKQLQNYIDDSYIPFENYLQSCKIAKKMQCYSDHSLVREFSIDIKPTRI